MAQVWALPTDTWVTLVFCQVGDACAVDVDASGTNTTPMDSTAPAITSAAAPNRDRACCAGFEKALFPSWFTIRDTLHPMRTNITHA